MKFLPMKNTTCETLGFPQRLHFFCEDSLDNSYKLCRVANASYALYFYLQNRQ